MALSGWGIFLIILVVAVIAAAIGYILYTHYRARRLGLPPPSLNPFTTSSRSSGNTYRAPAPRPGGLQGWLSDKWRALNSSTNSRGRSTGGGYESTGYGGGRPSHDRRAFGPLDPDEAWDARVDNETSGYYEEQELGEGPYRGSGYGDNSHVGVGGIEEGRGRSRSRQRELDARYEEEVHGGGGSGSARNPFGDHAEAEEGLRAVSPRPDRGYQGARGPSHKKGNGSLGEVDESPTERRSMFREDV